MHDRRNINHLPEPLIRRPVQPRGRSSLTRTTPLQAAKAPPRYDNDIRRPPRTAHPARQIRPQPQRSQVLQRQFTQPAAAASSQAEKHLSLTARLRAKPQVALIIMACLVFGLGLLVDLQTLQTNHNAKAQVAALSKNADGSSAGAPGENKPDSNAINNYQVAPGLPKYLKIAKLDVYARIRPLDLTNSNALQAPANIYDTGWYDGSARPGDPGSNGAVVIDGHVHGPTQPGVFVNLAKLSSGDTIQIVRGDNQLFTYKVVKVQNYDANKLNMRVALASVQPGHPGLSLITCSGRYNAASGQYTQRTIVFAVQT